MDVIIKASRDTSYFLSGLEPDLFSFLDYLLCNLVMEVRWKYTDKSFVNIKYLLQPDTSKYYRLQLTGLERESRENLASG